MASPIAYLPLINVQLLSNRAIAFTVGSLCNLQFEIDIVTLSFGHFLDKAVYIVIQYMYLLSMLSWDPDKRDSIEGRL